MELTDIVYEVVNWMHVIPDKEKSQDFENKWKAMQAA